MNDEEAMEESLMDIKLSERLWVLPVEFGPGLLYLGDGAFLGYTQGTTLNSKGWPDVVLDDILDAELIGE